jgi:uncharacterized membrane protein YbhN (UPF0104 family)
MQVKHNRLKVLLNALKLIILLICLYFIYLSLKDQPPLHYEEVTGRMGWLLLVILLAIPNWFLEILRWHISLKEIGRDNFRAAMHQVLAGLALNWLAPFTTGDLMTRLGPAANKKLTALMIFWNRAPMLAMTLLMGLLGLYYYSHQVFSDQLAWILLLLFLLAALAAIIFRKWPGKTREIRPAFLSRLIFLSATRYTIFVVQFGLLLYAFNPFLSYDVILAGVGWVFLFRSLVPSLFGNLGVREASALVFFEGWTDDLQMILLPSVLIWMINTVLPSLPGMYFLYKIRFKLAG